MLAMQRPKRSREISDQVEMMERRTTRATPAPPRGASPSSGGPWQMAVNPASEKPSGGGGQAVSWRTQFQRHSLGLLPIV